MTSSPPPKNLMALGVQRAVLNVKTRLIQRENIGDMRSKISRNWKPICYPRCGAPLRNAHAGCRDLERALISFDSSPRPLKLFRGCPLIGRCLHATFRDLSDHAIVFAIDVRRLYDICDTKEIYFIFFFPLPGESQDDVRGRGTFYENISARAYSFQLRIPFTLWD